MVSSVKKKKKMAKLYSSPISSTFYDIVIDGIDILNGDFEALILNIKYVMDTKANWHLVSVSGGIFSFHLPSIHTR